MIDDMLVYKSTVKFVASFNITKKKKGKFHTHTLRFRLIPIRSKTFKTYQFGANLVPKNYQASETFFFSCLTD